VIAGRSARGDGGAIYVSVNELVFPTSLGFQDVIGPNAMIGPNAGASSNAAGNGLDLDYILVHGSWNPFL
jgi:hypothetical protein